MSTDYLLGRKKTRALDLAGLTDEQAATITALSRSEIPLFHGRN